MSNLSLASVRTTCTESEIDHGRVVRELSWESFLVEESIRADVQFWVAMRNDSKDRRCPIGIGSCTWNGCMSMDPPKCSTPMFLT